MSVRLENVRKAFGQTAVLKGCSLNVAASEHVAVTGANGSGKTTLLRILASVAAADSGTVEILGTTPQLARLRVGYLGHNPPLSDSLSAEENIRFWAKIYRCEARKELIETVGLDLSDKRAVGTFSQGMRKRLGLACVLQPNPRLVLIDEPFAALDEGGMQTFSKLLISREFALIVATHDTDRARVFSDRTITLEDGKLR